MYELFGGNQNGFIKKETLADIFIKSNPKLTYKEAKGLSEALNWKYGRGDDELNQSDFFRIFLEEGNIKSSIVTKANNCNYNKKCLGTSNVVFHGSEPLHNIDKKKIKVKSISQFRGVKISESDGLIKTQNSIKSHNRIKSNEHKRKLQIDGLDISPTPKSVDCKPYDNKLTKKSPKRKSPIKISQKSSPKKNRYEIKSYSKITEEDPNSLKNSGLESYKEASFMFPKSTNNNDTEDHNNIQFSQKLDNFKQELEPSSSKVFFEKDDIEEVRERDNITKSNNNNLPEVPFLLQKKVNEELKGHFDSKLTGDQVLSKLENQKVVIKTDQAENLTSNKIQNETDFVISSKENFITNEDQSVLLS